MSAHPSKPHTPRATKALQELIKDDISSQTARGLELIAAGADPNATSPYAGSGTILHTAFVRRADAAFIKALVRAGGDVNRPASCARPATALHLAIMHGRNSERTLDLVKATLDAGADPELVEKRGYTALRLAIEYHRFNDLMATITLLLERGADANGRLRGDMTPLFISTNAELTSLLLSHGADASHQSADGSTPLMPAAARGDAESIKLLCRAGANPNAQMEGGLTALHRATKRSNMAAVQELMRQGANPDLKDDSGSSPRDLAFQLMRPELAQAMGFEITAATLEHRQAHIDSMREALLDQMEANGSRFRFIYSGYDKFGDQGHEVYFNQGGWLKKGSWEYYFYDHNTEVEKAETITRLRAWELMLKHASSKDMSAEEVIERIERLVR